MAAAAPSLASPRSASLGAHAGIYNICRFGGAGVFRALSPHYMYYFWSGDASGAWRALGNIMLCVTGAEALYADMGARHAGHAVHD